jgi:hypothetical protein
MVHWIRAVCLDPLYRAPRRGRHRTLCRQHWRDSHDNALAETVHGLFRTELIRRRGPWRSLEAVELAIRSGCGCPKVRPGRDNLTELLASANDATPPTTPDRQGWRRAIRRLRRREPLAAAWSASPPHQFADEVGGVYVVVDSTQVQ